jgi:hypothetical protein
MTATRALKREPCAIARLASRARQAAAGGQDFSAQSLRRRFQLANAHLENLAASGKRGVDRDRRSRKMIWSQRRSLRSRLETERDRVVK